MFEYSVTIYYEDTDVSGVVYHANYLKFMERARTQIITGLGFEHNALKAQDIAFVVSGLSIDYLGPAELGDILSIQTTITKLGKASVNFMQKVVCGAVLVSQADVRIACVSVQTFKPCKMPTAIWEQFALHV